jgi:hypothetical protein
MKRTVISLEPTCELKPSQYDYPDDARARFLNDLDRDIKQEARLNEIKEAESIERAKNLVMTI